MQEEKSKFFLWKWEWTQEKKYIKDISAKLKVNGKELEQIKVIESKKTLGVYLSSSL